MLALSVGCALAFAASSTVRSKHADKFQQMLSDVTLSPRAIEFIDAPKQRILFRGVLAAIEEPSVVSAFEILYSDIGPIRAAGNVIFGQLAKVAATATENAASSGDIAALASLARSKNIFRLVDSDASGSLDRAELASAPELLALIRQDGDAGDAAAVERFMSAVDTNGDGVISFVEFANAAAVEPLLQMDESDELAALGTSRELFDLLDSDTSGSLERAELASSPELLALIRRDGESDDDAVERFMSVVDANGDGVISFLEFSKAAAANLQMTGEVLAATLATMEAIEPVQRRRFGRMTPDERFDRMLEACVSWRAEMDAIESAAAEGGSAACTAPTEEQDDRFVRVLKGALDGASVEPLTSALRVCYLEYTPLRLGGDLIFKTLKRVVATQLPKGDANQ